MNNVKINVNGHVVDGKFVGNKDYKFFVYDEANDVFYFFRTEDERDKVAEYLIRGHLDDGWYEGVEQIICGEITHTCEKVNVVHRPPEDEIDDDGCDSEGNYWAEEWEYKCDYQMIKLEDK